MQINKLLNPACTYNGPADAEQRESADEKLDSRFEDDGFCADVLLVMEHLGLACTVENFKHYDRILNWHAVAQSIANPVHVARCYMLWGRYHKRWWRSETDRRIYKAGKPVVVYRDLHGKTAEEALAGLDTEAYEFIEWWG